MSHIITADMVSAALQQLRAMHQIAPSEFGMRCALTAALDVAPKDAPADPETDAPIARLRFDDSAAAVEIVKTYGPGLPAGEHDVWCCPVAEGCTPSDVLVLREANARMAQELHELRAAPLHVGACITDGKLYVTVMRSEANEHVTVVAQAEMAAASLHGGGCLALAAPTPVAQPARWYMVNNIGMATLCTDEYDARIEAANANEQYPMHRPHRAVQLVEVAGRKGGAA